MKKLHRISHMILVLGWLPFVFLCVFGSQQSVNTQVYIALFGIFVCVTGSFMILSVPEQVYDTLDELINEINETRKTRNKLNEIINKLTNEKE